MMTSQSQPLSESTDRLFPVSLTVRQTFITFCCLYALPPSSSTSPRTVFINTVTRVCVFVCRWHPLPPALLPVPSQRPVGHGQRWLLRYCAVSYLVSLMFIVSCHIQATLPRGKSHHSGYSHREKSVNSSSNELSLILQRERKRGGPGHKKKE